MVDDFLIRAGLAGLAVALVAAPLGVFVVWRRMAFLGAAIAHSGLLGVAFAVLMGVHLLLGVTVISFAIALLFMALERQKLIPSDTLLGILAHVALAGGLLLTTALGAKADLHFLLFGDILSVTRSDFIPILGGGGFVLAVLMWLWRPLLAMSVHPELARIEGVQVDRVQLIFLLLISVTIALTMKIVGILLVASLLILPASAARPFSSNPEQMAILAAIIGVISVLLGLCLSAIYDFMPGPAIVMVLAVIFAGTVTARQILSAET